MPTPELGVSGMGGVSGSSDEQPLVLLQQQRGYLFKKIALKKSKQRRVGSHS
jgi:hypothetical protein